jgi:hypothetical protein
MSKQGGQTQDTKKQAAAHELSKTKSDRSGLQFVDNRAGTVVQQKLQAMADDNPRVKQLRAIQEMADKKTALQQPAVLQAKTTDTASETASPTRRTAAGKNKTGLPEQLKSGIEELSGFSMEDVKVNYNSEKPAQLQAHAYAQGSEINIAPGQEKHLPHEAWHVVQQKQGRVQPTVQMKGGVNVNDNTDLEREADVMGAKAIRALSSPQLQVHEAAASTEAPSQLKSATPQPLNSTTVQLVRIPFGMGEYKKYMRREDTKFFPEYIKSLGFTFKNNVIDTGEKETTIEDIMSGFGSYVESQNKEKAEELQPEVLHEKRTALGAEVVHARYSGAKITRLDTDGKNNLGIYEVVTERGTLIVKILGKGLGHLREAKDDIDMLKKEFNPLQDGIKIDINQMLECDIVGDDPVQVGVAVFRKHGVMTLEKALLHQDLPVETLAAAAKGLAVRVAALHFSPIRNGKTEKGSYIFHKDLNTSNLMLDYEGIVGLIDNDSLSLTNDVSLIYHDVNDLFVTLKRALGERYAGEKGTAERVFAAMKTAFLEGYASEMQRTEVPNGKAVFEGLEKYVGK